MGIVLTAVLAFGASQAWAQDEPELGWSDTAELTMVFTGGNAQSSTLGLRNQLKRIWDGAVLTADVGILRANSTQITRTATGFSPASFILAEDSVTALTAANYFVRGRYERQVNERLFWYAGTGWERNTFAGVASRSTWVGGVGHIWRDDDTATFRTAYGLSYTVQDDVVDVVGSETSFAGLRLSYDYRRQLTPTTEFTSALVADENLQEGGDFRSNLTNTVAVSMTSQLALKVSWQLLYDNRPSFAGVALRLPSGLPAGRTVLVELDKLDTFLTFALVASF
jgi:putative salt-induced outer membrane protein YdiY